jgi:hypothetical protein
VAARLCTQCGGALVPGEPTCQWCGTPVAIPSPPTSPSPKHWDWDSSEAEPDEEDNESSPLTLFLDAAVLGLIGSAAIAVGLGEVSTCGGSAPCNAAGAEAIVALGAIFVLLAIVFAVAGLRIVRRNRSPP